MQINIIIQKHIVCLRIWLDIQSVSCVHSVGLGSSWLVLVIFLNDSVQILVTPLYLSFCIYHLSNRHMMSGHVWTLSVFVFIIVLTWYLHPSAFVFLYSAENKLNIYGPNLLFVLMYVLVSADLSLHLERLLYPSVITRRCQGVVFDENGVI